LQQYPKISLLLALAFSAGSLAGAAGAPAPTARPSAAATPPSRAAARPRAPAIPRDMDPVEQNALTRSALLLSRGQHAQALTMLKSLAVPTMTHLYVDLSVVPPAVRPSYLSAVGAAVHSWNAALPAALRFSLVDQPADAELTLAFQRDVARVDSGQARLQDEDGGADLLTTDPPGASSRTETILIATQVPYTTDLHSAASITHLAAQALGRYLGLPATPDASSVMGPDTRNPDVLLRPASSDVERVKAIQASRQALIAAAQRGVTLYLPQPVMVVREVQLDAGKVERGDDAHFVFQVQNTGDAPLEIAVRPNCGCTVANFDHEIAPGAEGKIAADVHTAAFRGRILKSAELTSNDLEHPHVTLLMGADIQSLLEVLPTDVPVVFLKDGGATTEPIKVRVRAGDPLEITGIQSSAAYATATAEPAGTDNGSRLYNINLTVGPAAPLGRAALTLTLSTSSPREPQDNVAVLIEKGIVATPVSLFLGSINPRVTLPITQVAILNKHDGAFHIKNIDSGDPHLQVKQDMVQDGTEYRLTVSYTGGWPNGAVQDKITIQTDDPIQPTIEIPVIASVVTTPTPAG
jgi:hypothetical protein